MDDLFKAEEEVLVNLTKSVADIQLFIKEGYEAKDFGSSDDSCHRKYCELVLYYFEQTSGTLPPSVVTDITGSDKLLPTMKADLVTNYQAWNLATPHPIFKDVLERWQCKKRDKHLRQLLSRWVERKADGVDATVLIQEIKDATHDFTKKFNKQATLYCFGEDPDAEMLDLEERRRHPELFQGLNIGFPSIDRALRGLKPGLYLIYGGTKAGKSVLMVNVGRNAISAGKRVLYHVNEGGTQLVRKRMLSCYTGIPVFEIDAVDPNQSIPPEQYKAEYDCFKAIGEKGLLLIDSVTRVDSTVPHLRQKLDEIADRHGPVDLVLVDLFTYMSTTRKARDRWQELGNIAEDLKELSAEFNVPIIGIGHLNREGNITSSPDISHLGQSILPAQFCDAFAVLSAEDPEALKRTGMGAVEMNFLGVRDGATPVATLFVDYSIMKMKEIIFEGSTSPAANDIGTK